ncbi:MAG: glycosyltransferase [Acidithiobacillus sp.]|jgi:hypothetical protein|uniref:glycosyltransferase n=1 Tax=Acidithiobacillus sp. TaxID=1872118 RepID=UPI0035611A6A
MKKVVVNVDIPNWAFDRIYHGLKKYCTNYKIFCNYNCYLGNHNEFDIVVFLCDFHPPFLTQYNIPKEKVLFCVRSDVFRKDLDFYNSGKIKNYAKIVAASNRMLFDKCKTIHDNVKLIHGGVDTNVFQYKHRDFCSSKIIRVGWAGSNSNFGKEMRGLLIIEKACKIASELDKYNTYIFNPAYRETKWRTQSEMVSYYLDEIDVYVDMSEHAGRQNGLVEAGSCGIPLISSHAGIANELIEDSKNGILINRNVDELVDALLKIKFFAKNFSKNIRETIDKKWSWQHQSTLFENAFKELLEK